MTPLGPTRAAVTGGLVAVALVLADSPEWAAVAVVAGIAFAVVPVDLRRRRIPTPPVAVGGAAVVAIVGIALLQGDADRAATAAIGATLVGGTFLAVHLLTPAGVGFGDVRLATLTGACLGFGAGLPATVLAVAGASAVAAMTALGVRQRSVPFAPFLLSAAVLALVAAIG